jgi:replicative DNA helicase
LTSRGTAPDKLGPRDLEAEQALLGACLVSEQALAIVLGSIRPEDFFADIHREMYAAIRKAADEHGRADYVLCAPYCSHEGARGLRDLYDAVPSVANTANYCRVVRDASRARRTLDVVGRIRQRALSRDYKDTPEFALSLIDEAAREDNDKGAMSYAAALDRFDELIRMRQENDGITGIRTGLTKIDAELGGLNRGISYIIAARPGMGKSLVAGQIAQTAANQNYRVLLQTPEMSAVQYLDRLAHALAGVHYQDARRGRLSAAEAHQVRQAARMISKLPFYVDDAGGQTVARIRSNVMRYKPDLVIVDYLQYVQEDNPDENRNHQVGAISRGLTRIKSDFDIPVLLCAQLSRGVESRNDKRPNLADLRDSGEIEQDADAVMFLYRPYRYNKDAPEDLVEVHCEKWREGDLFESHLYLRPGANWLVNQRGE